MTANGHPEFGSRELLPDLEARAYLNFAAIAPLCAPVVAAIEEAVRDYARSGVVAFPRWEARREQLRRDFATLIGAQPNEIALGWNTSRGVSDIALSLPWKTGDRVLLFTGEFPANVSPWQRAAELFGLSIVFHDASSYFGDAGLQRLEDELKRGLRLVAVSTVQFQTGLRMPLSQMGALCRRHGAELFVDAIQACGAVPVDVVEAGVDYLATGGHKWLLGSEGAGFLYVRDDCAKRLRPYTSGWLSHEDAAAFLFRGAGHLRYDRPLVQGADVFHAGTANLLGLAALGASVPLLLELGPQRIHEHVNAYLDALEPGLIERGFESLRSADPARRSCILSVKPPMGLDAPRVAAALRAEQVITGTPDGYLRFAPHFFNALAEVPLVLESVDRVLDGLHRAV